MPLNTLSSSSVDFHVEVRRPEGEVLAREDIPRAYLQPIVEEALWRAWRNGSVGDDRSALWWDVQPRLGRDGRANAVAELELHVGDGHTTVDGAPAKTARTQRFSMDVFDEPAQEVVRRLLAARVLTAGDRYEVTILAHVPQEELRAPASAEAASSFHVVHRESVPPLVEGRLEDWQARSTLLNPDAADEHDTPVFITESALEQAHRFCRRPGVREGGAALVGELKRQWQPKPEIFVVIDGCFEALHADRTRFSLTPTTDTYRHFEKQLALRRRRLGRPAELLLGIAHGHNFAPALDEQHNALCPSCPKQATCTLNSAYYSLDDSRFHKALFTKQVFAVGLVWGFTPREEDVLRVYGFRNGALRERAIHRVD